MTAPLFRSDGQARLLAELFLSGAEELNVRELAARVVPVVGDLPWQ